MPDHNRLRWCLLLLLSLGLLTPLQALQLADRSGASYSGQLETLFQGVVTLRQDSGEVLELPLFALDDASQAAVAKWASQNPARVDVHARVDKRPEVLKASHPVLPAELLRVKGMVSVVLTLDEAGTVLEVEVQKSTDERLDAPTLAALRSWRFQPAEVDSKPVRTRLVVPVRFEGM